MGVVYQNYFQGGDTWSYYEDAIGLSSLASTDPVSYLVAVFSGNLPAEFSGIISYSGQPRAFLMVRIVSVLALITGGSYWLSSAYFSLFSFCGLWTLTGQVVKLYPNSTKAALAAFIFLPTICFWGSGITKESIYLGGFGFITAWFWPYFLDYSIKNLSRWTFTIIMLLVLVPLKYYYMAVFLSVLITSNAYHGFGLKGKLNWILLFGVLLFGVSWLHPNLNLTYVSELMQTNAHQIQKASDSKAIVRLFNHDNPIVWAGINLPWAVFTGLYRPNIGDWGSMLQNLVVFEYLLLLIFTVGRLTSLRRKQLIQADWLACLIYVIVLAGMLTLSTPNFGTLVRFKASFLSVFAFMILHNNKWWIWIFGKMQKV